MFVWSVRSSTLKFIAGVLSGVLLLVTLIAFLPGEEGGTIAGQVAAGAVIHYDNVKTDADRAAFLRQFGWEIKNEPVSEVKLTVPQDFDKLFTSYNQIQLRQGLDLSDYRRKEVTRYTYEVTNYENYTGQVLASVIVYRDTVIAGDICSADLGENSFVHGFEKPA